MIGFTEVVSVVEITGQPPLLDALGRAALHSLWQGAILALVLWALSAPLRRRPRAWHRAHAGALALMLLLPAATAVYLVIRAPEPEVHLLPSTVSDRTESAATSPPPEAAGPPAPAAWLARVGNTLAAAGSSWLGALWLAGVFGLSLWWIGERTTGPPGRSAARPAPERCRRKIRRLSRRLRLRRPVEVTESARVDVPTMVGFRRPLLVLPAGTRDNLSSLQIDAILAHHLAHLKLYDDLTALLLRVVETLLFFHPAVWWISRRLRRGREVRSAELAARVTGHKPTYTQAVASLEALRGSQRLLRTGAEGCSPEARFERLACFSPHHLNHSARAVAGVLCLVLLALGAVGGALLAPAEERPSGTVLDVPEGTRARIEGRGRLIVLTAERQVQFVDSYPVGETDALATGEQGEAYLFHADSPDRSGFWEAVLLPARVPSQAKVETSIAGDLRLEMDEATALELEFVDNSAVLRSHSALPTVAVGMWTHPLPTELARQIKAFGIDPERASAVWAVGHGTPAERSGLRRGDIITHIDGQPIGAGLGAVLRGKHPGDALIYQIWRRGKVLQTRVTLEPRERHERTLEGLTAPPLEAREVLPADSQPEKPVSSLTSPLRSAG